MMIQIEMTETGPIRYYVLSTEKATMSVSVHRNYVQVCSHNATAALYRNVGGMVFYGPNALADAAKNYKSAASKAMIDAVQRAEQAIASAAASTVAA